MSNRFFIISIQPKYAKKIFSGEKTVELRKKNISALKKSDKLIIYVTSPEQLLYGICTVENVIEDSPEKLWRKVSKHSGITKEEYFAYYKTADKAIGIYLRGIRKLEKPISLKDMRTSLNGFMPPQSYMRFDREKHSNLFESNLLNKYCFA
jgi:predicted transcriptional regulator